MNELSSIFFLEICSSKFYWIMKEIVDPMNPIFPFKDPMNPIFHYTIDIKKGFSPFKNNEISETCSKDEKEKLDTNCSKLCV